MKIHKIFHPNLFRKASTDPLTQVNEPPPPVIVNNEEKWEVEDILDSRSYQEKVQCRVKLFGWDEDRGFDNYPDIIEDFHFRYPNKPRLHNKRKQSGAKKWEVGNWEYFYYFLARGTSRLDQGVMWWFLPLITYRVTTYIRWRTYVRLTLHLTFRQLVVM